MRGLGDHAAAREQLRPEMFARIMPPVEITQPGPEGVHPRRDEELPKSEGVGNEARRPEVVALAFERDRPPASRFAVPHVESALELLVAVADDVGLDPHPLAHDPFRRETAAVDLGPDAVDDDPASQQAGGLHCRVIS